MLPPLSDPDKPFDDGGELYGKLIEICDVEEGISEDSLDILLYR